MIPATINAGRRPQCDPWNNGLNILTRPLPGPITTEAFKASLRLYALPTAIKTHVIEAVDYISTRIAKTTLNRFFADDVKLLELDDWFQQRGVKKISRGLNRSERPAEFLRLTFVMLQETADAFEFREALNKAIGVHRHSFPRETATHLAKTCRASLPGWRRGDMQPAWQMLPEVEDLELVLHAPGVLTRRLPLQQLLWRAYCPHCATGEPDRLAVARLVANKRRLEGISPAALACAIASRLGITTKLGEEEHETFVSIICKFERGTFSPDAGEDVVAALDDALVLQDELTNLWCEVSKRTIVNELVLPNTYDKELTWLTEHFSSTTAALSLRGECRTVDAFGEDVRWTRIESCRACINTQLRVLYRNAQANGLAIDECNLSLFLFPDEVIAADVRRRAQEPARPTDVSTKCLLDRAMCLTREKTGLLRQGWKRMISIEKVRTHLPSLRMPDELPYPEYGDPLTTDEDRLVELARLAFEKYRAFSASLPPPEWGGMSASVEPLLEPNYPLHAIDQMLDEAFAVLPSVESVYEGDPRFRESPNWKLWRNLMIIALSRFRAYRSGTLAKIVYGDLEFGSKESVALNLPFEKFKNHKPQFSICPPQLASRLIQWRRLNHGNAVPQPEAPLFPNENGMPADSGDILSMTLRGSALAFGFEVSPHGMRSLAVTYGYYFDGATGRQLEVLINDSLKTIERHYLRERDHLNSYLIKHAHDCRNAFAFMTSETLSSDYGLRRCPVDNDSTKPRSWSKIGFHEPPSEPC